MLSIPYEVLKRDLLGTTSLTESVQVIQKLSLKSQAFNKEVEETFSCPKSSGTTRGLILSAVH